MPERVKDVTTLLGDAAAGDAAARNQLYGLVYERLKYIARNKLRHERPGYTLTATDLVDMAATRIDGATFANRREFFGVLGKTMERILIERARRKRLPRQNVCPDNVMPGRRPEESLDTLLTLHEALEKLESQRPELAEVVYLKFFVGLKDAETAGELGISERTVRRHWKSAKAELLVAVGPEAALDGP